MYLNLPRTTAKKFLAAANFLELLQVFERSSNADIVSDYNCEFQPASLTGLMQRMRKRFATRNGKLLTLHVLCVKVANLRQAL